MDLKQAQKFAEKAIELAEKAGENISVVIVDNSGRIVLINRMEASFPVSPEIAQTKAYTSATLGMNTADMADYAQPGKPYYGVQSILGGSFTTIAGGAVIKDGEGNIIGGIGIGGSYDVSKDQEIAIGAIS